MKKRLYYSAAAVLTAVALPASVMAMPNSSGSIDTTGPDSYNKIELEDRTYKRVHNNNNVGVDNNNHQFAHSDDATVWRNTTGGSARSGNASNSNTLRLDASISNTGAAATATTSGGNKSGSIRNTGPDSYNKVEVENRTYVSVKNDNNVSVTNNNSQYAKSGDARVISNTTGGSATSGNATNTSTSQTTLRISN